MKETQEEKPYAETFMTQMSNAVQDDVELKAEQERLELNRFKGSNNVCRACHRPGHFGSIVRYTCQSGAEYLICGWCGYCKRMSR